MFILFLISVFGLITLFSWKLFEIKTGKVLISKKALNKSNSFLEDSFINIKRHYNNFTHSFPRVSHTLIESILNKILFYLVKIKALIVKKLLSILGIDEEVILSKNRGSASLFLRNISEDRDKRL